MSGQVSNTAGPLVSPLLSGAEAVVGASAAIGRAMRDIQRSQHSLVAATVVQNLNQNVDKTVINMVIDGAPTTPVQVHTQNGWAPPVGARLMVLLFPPRGVLILGQISDSILVTQTGQSASIPGQVFASLQTFENGTFGGILYLNDDPGSTLISTPMRAMSAEGGNITQTTTSTAFVNIGTAATDLTMPYPGSGVMVVTISGAISASSATTTGADFSIGSFEIRDGNSSGTIRYAANDNQSMYTTGGSGGSNVAQVRSRLVVVTGLPKTGTMFMRPMFRTSVATNTCTWSHPAIAATPSL